MIAGFVAIALQLAALGAPLFHAHLDDHHQDHHGVAGVHAHMGGHERAHHVRPVDGPVIGEDEDGEVAIAVQLFVAAEPLPLAIPAPPPRTFTLPGPLESISPKPPAVGHSHDPPAGRPAAPRGPPAFPS